MSSRLQRVSVLLLLAAACCLSACDRFSSPAALVEEGRASMERGEFSTAGIALRNALKREPEDAQARLMLARVTFLMGDVAAARDELDRAMRNGAPAVAAADLEVELRLAMGEAGKLLDAVDKGELAMTEPERLVARGRALNALERSAEAITEFERVLATQPDSVSARIGLAEALAASARSDDALASLDKVLAANPDTVRGRILKSRILAGRGQYALAQAALGDGCGGMPPATALTERAACLVMLAEAQLARGEISEAEATHTKLSQVSSGSVMAALLHARIALAKGDYRGGVAGLQRLVVAVPNFVPARMLLGAAHLARGDMRQAEDQLAQVVELAPDNIEARKLLARVRLQLDHPDAALRTLTPALEQDSGDSELSTLLSAAHMRAGEKEKAVEVLESSARAEPDNLQRQLELAAAYLTAGRHASATQLLRSLPPGNQDSRREALLIAAIEAERGPVAARAELEQLLAAQPQNTALLRLAAEYFMSHREFDRARSYLARVLEAKSEDASSLVALARLERAAGNGSAAEAALVRAATKAPADASIQLALAKLYLTQGDAAKGSAAIEKAVAATPGRAEVVNLAGLLLLESQRFDEALARFRRASELNADEPRYWLNTARAQLALSQSAPARESLGRAIKLQPDWLPAEAMLVLLEQRTRGSAAALAKVRDLRQRHPDEPAVPILEGDILMAARQYGDAVRAYESAEKLRRDAEIAVKLHQALLLSNADQPEAPLERWLATHTEDNRIRVVLAQYYTAKSLLVQARTELETVHQQAPGNPAMMNNLAWVYFELGDKRAEEMARRAHALAPSVPAIADTYGWILMRTRQPDRALPLLEQAARGAENDAEIQYHYAAALVAAGRRDEARSVLQRVVAMKPGAGPLKDAQKLLSELES